MWINTSNGRPINVQPKSNSDPKLQHSIWWQHLFILAGGFIMTVSSWWGAGLEGGGATRQLDYISSEERSMSVRLVGNCTCDCPDSLAEKSTVSRTEYRPQMYSCVRKIKITVHLFSSYIKQQQKFQSLLPSFTVAHKALRFDPNPAPLDLISH